MKTHLIAGFVAMALLSSACGEKDKSAQLADLKKQQAELASQITQLETELQKEGKGSAPIVTAVPVTVVTVQPETFRHYLEVQGRVDFDQNVMVSPKVPGVLTSLRVDPGSRVSRGQTLATIDAGPLDQQIAALRPNLDLARTIYQKQKNLWDQKIGTEIQFLQAKNNVESLERQLAAMQAARAQYIVKAPISGEVDQVVPKSGEAVAPGMGIIRLVNANSGKIVAEVSEAYASKIRKGDEALVMFPDLNQEIRTTVRVVGSNINPNNRSFTVELGVKPADQGKVNLRPNMVAVVRIQDYVKENALSLPLDIVQKDEQGNFVYVAEQKGGQRVAVKRPITTGASYGGKVEVSTGLNAQDQVIRAGAQNLNEGQPVVF
ncbi:efflux RND transporter periplasmic adaptor subunit [Rufibacter glacialis]|uniref:Efflux RND transporter periplasmic adaptor subunit n=1 Tax=Rufibacter glacialis TaxID=1259555 RepID=A0A5M8Q2R6_9BACT|nr:efflux RND transporter periplasmic adaptor subunit [Rufibacter glacialis]KAA6430195.1 efflux RND transporter periplasmic adaptor subunit [Rufibacter glacialis]GGK87198.1 RND transporter [Rufibacter glacialis]